MNHSLVNPRLAARMQALSRAAAISVIAVGGLVVLGWLLNIDALKIVLPGSTPMKFNSALCFILAGVALLRLREGSSRLTTVFGAVVALVGILTLLEYSFGWNLGIDQWLVHEAVDATQTVAPGRMSPVTAFNFCLIGMGLLFMTRSTRIAWAQLLALGATLTALLSLVGYLYGAEELYQIGTFIPIALFTGITFVVLSFGILFAYPEHGLAGVILANRAGGLLARRLLPAAIVIPLVIGWLRLKGQEAGLYDTEFGLALFTMSNIILFTVLIFRNARALNRVDGQRSEATEALHQANAQLEAQVEKRTAELRKSEALLQQSEAKFSTAFRASPAAISLASLPDGRWIDVNDALAKMTGYSREELIGHTSAELGLIDEVSRARILEATRVHGKVRDVEIEMRTKSKEVLVVLVSTERIELDGQAFALTIQYDITKLKHAEAALRENEQKLQTFFNILPVGVSVMNREGHIVEMNPALENIMGMSSDGLKNGAYRSRKFISSDGSPMAVSDFPSANALLKQAEVHDVEVGVVNEDGVTLWTSVSATPLPLADSGVIIVTVDITERKEAGSRFQALLESAPDAMVIVNHMGNIVLVNSQTEKLFGYARQELVGKPVETLIPERFSKLHPAHRNGYIADPHVRSMGVGLELYALRKDGSQFSVEISLSPIETAEGVLIAAAVRDVTERKHEREALAQLAAIVESSDDAIISKSLDSIIVSWNSGAQRIFGYSADEVIGKPIDILFPPERLDDEPIFMEKLKQGILIDDFETVRVTKDGRQIPVSLTISPIRNADGVIIGASKIARDITERKRVEEQLATQAQELALSHEVLEQNNRELHTLYAKVSDLEQLKTDMIRIASHDLLALVNVFTGYIDILRPEIWEQLSAEQQGYFDDLASTSDRMERLTKDILSLDRIEAAFSNQQNTLNLREMVELVFRQNQSLAQQKVEAFHLDTVPTALMVRGEPAQLQEAITNLVGNAIKYTPEKGTVEIRLRQDGDKAVFEVQDTGYGIPDEMQQHLFQAFYRAKSQETAHIEGTGLGLYLVKRVIERHQGHIYYKSIKGEGSTFGFELPLALPQIEPT